MSVVRRRRRNAGGGTNAWTFSEQLDNAAWTLITADSAYTIDAVAAPDGTISAEKVRATTVTNTNHGFSRAMPAGVTANVKQTVSFYVKPAEKNWCWVRMTAKDATVRTGWFNAATGANGTVNASLTFRSSFVGNGWYRLSITTDPLAGAGAGLVEIGFCDVDNARAYASVIGDGMYFWGLQFELNTLFPGAYVKTTNNPI